jgi:hypothetical protein
VLIRGSSPCAADNSASYCASAASDSDSREIILKDVNVPKEKFASETIGDSVPISSLTFFVGKPPYT